MKKHLFTIVGICFLAAPSWAQQPVNKHISTASSTKPDIDVSGKSMIRFNMDQTTQAQRDQANADRSQALLTTNSNYHQDRNAYEKQIQQLVEYYSKNGQSTQAVITIPVVVHVVWKTTAQNIPDNQVFSQMQVLNEDFGRTNADASQTPAVWTSIAANTTIQFCLAQQDPNGGATNGIERRNTTVTSFSLNDNVKQYSSGGLDAWDPTRYLNIWVCNLGSGLLGYGEFPTNSVSSTYGVVILYSAFGSNYTSYGTFSAIAYPYDRGRTTTHEFSHCFDLYHIWGDDNGLCSGSDYVSDTPNQGDATTTCYTYPHTDNCSTSNPGIMFMNYMDYSYDNCLNMFTAGQKTRMLAVLNSAPYNALQTSNGCTPVTTVGIDAGISVITTPGATVCGLTFTPVVTLKNFGATTLTSCTINYKIDNNTVQTYSWTGSLTTNGTASVTLASMTTTAGTHTFTAYTSNPNSTTDVNTANDQLQQTFTTSTSQSLPYAQGFEGSTFPPTGCTVNNPDAMTTWARTTAAAKTGVASMYMDNFNYNASGQVDEFVLPALDLQVSNPVLTFQVAYQLYTNPTASQTWSDTLKVWVSTNCGVSWTQVYYKYSTSLTTTTPTYSSTQFVPTATQWRLETIPLTAFSSSGSVLIKFRHTTDFENELYIDDINVQNSTGIQTSVLAGSLNLYPNPSATGLFNLELSLGSQQDVHVIVADAIGRTVSEFTVPDTYGGTFPIDLTAETNGVYFVTVIAGEEKTVQRVVISR
jgi:hypothetical protein